jgi:hypothetical protein
MEPRRDGGKVPIGAQGFLVLAKRWVVRADSCLERAGSTLGDAS